jgi:hypothetical protein
MKIPFDLKEKTMATTNSIALALDVTDSVTASSAVLVAGDKVCFTVASAGGGQSLNTFKIQIKAHATAEWVDYFGGSDWTDSSDVRLIWCSATPATLAAGASSTAIVIIGGAYQFRFAASTASGMASLTILGQQA